MSRANPQRCGDLSGTLSKGLRVARLLETIPPNVDGKRLKPVQAWLCLDAFLSDNSPKNGVDDSPRGFPRNQ